MASASVKRENAPYGPPSNVISIIRRFRDRNLPEQIDPGLLRDIGISPGNVHRTLVALMFLQLVDGTGQPTAQFHSLQMADEAEYQVILEGILRSSYKDIFNVVDPTKDPQHLVEGAFRRFQPASQRRRMAVLFLGLCSEAGVEVLDTPTQRRTRVESVTSQQKRRPRTQEPASKPDPGCELRDRTTFASAIDASQLRRQYIATLIKRLESIESPDETLLDRIERLLTAEASDAGSSQSE